MDARERERERERERKKERKRVRVGLIKRDLGVHGALKQKKTEA